MNGLVGFCWTDWLVFWLIGWVVGWVDFRLFGWLAVCWMVGGIVGWPRWLVDGVVCCVVRWLNA